MWTVVLPPANNPVLDDHILGAISMVVLGLTAAGTTWGLGQWWNRTALVRQPALAPLTPPRRRSPPSRRGRRRVRSRCRSAERDPPHEAGAAVLGRDRVQLAAEVDRAAAGVGQPALVACAGKPAAVVLDRELEPVAVGQQLDRRRARRPRGGRRCSAPRGARRAARPATRSPVAVSTGPLLRTTGGKPSGSAYSSASARTRARTPPGRASRSSKIVERMSRIVSSRSATAWSSRSAHQRRRRPSPRTPCSCSPVANRRWITTSWRSRAIRSRSLTTASSARSVTACIRSSASAAWVRERRQQLAVLVRRSRPAAGRPDVPPPAPPAG